MSAPSGQHKLLKRRAMTTGMLTLTVFCCVSGGPFGLEPLISTSGAGVALLLIHIMPILWALPDALTSCELAPAIPVEGGYVVWVKRAMGPFFGFLNAWWTWIYALIDAAIYPVLFTTYLRQLLAGFGVRTLENELASWLVAVTIIAIFTSLNIRGTRLVGRTSSAFAILLIAPFILLVLIGLFRLPEAPGSLLPATLTEGGTVTGALAAGLAIIMWNYLGWDALSTIAEEVDEPAKAYPRALLVGVPLVTAVYFLPTLIGLAFLPDVTRWEEGAWPVIAEAVGGPWLGRIINVVALVSPLALFTATLLGSSRVPFVLAEDGYLPRGLVRIHPKFGTPVRAILLCSVVYAVLAWRSFVELVELNVIMYSCALVLETGALLVLRWKEPELHRPFKIPGGWPVLILIFILPVSMAVLLVVLSVLEEGWRAQLPSLVAIASGPVVYGCLQLWKRLAVRSSTG